MNEYQRQRNVSDSNSHVFVPKDINDRAQLIWVSYSNQLKNKVKTLRSCTLTEVVDCGDWVLFLGFYVYGLHVEITKRVVVYYTKESREFVMFIKSELDFVAFRDPCAPTGFVKKS